MSKFKRVLNVSFYLLLITCLITVNFDAVNANEAETVPFAPDRKSDEGMGPFNQLVIKGATVIDGTGAPPEGPVDVIIEGNIIKEISGTKESYPESTQVIDAEGMYVLPGFVDTHGHIGGVSQGVSAEYVYKLWLAHGVTTVREPGSFTGIDWVLHEKERSEKNEIVAPRIYAYVSPGDWDKGPLSTPEDGKEYVKWAKKKGADGFKLRRIEPPVMEAIIKEANEQDLGTTTHLVQNVVTKDYIPNMSDWGLGSIEHWYGIPEALFDDQTVQDFSADYNYSNEYDRFSQAGELWNQAAEPGSEQWNTVMDQLLENNVAMSPTFGIYEATRDQMRVRNEDWHELYTAPSLQEFYEPSATSHGSFFFDWTTGDEITWKENYKVWMEFINEYKNKGGKVVTGSDSGFIYRTYGFGYIRELELLQEAGFHPLEVIRSATLNGAELLTEENNEELNYGTVRAGMLADLVLIDENPLHNLKYLYGTGAIKLNTEKGEVERVGGVNYTIKDGIVYDAKKLLDDVEEMVQKEKEASTKDSAEITRPSQNKALNLSEENVSSSGYTIPLSTVGLLIIPFTLIILFSAFSLYRRKEKEVEH